MNVIKLSIAAIERTRCGNSYDCSVSGRMVFIGFATKEVYAASAVSRRTLE